MLCLPTETASVFPCFCIFPAMPLNIPSVDLTRSQVYHNGDLPVQRPHRMNNPDLLHRKGTFTMITEVNKSTEANKATNRRFYEEVINQKRLAVVDEVAGANYVSYSFPPGLPPGREGLKAFISAFHTAFPDGHLSVDHMIASGDTVATRLTFRGTHTGDFIGIPPTGKKVTVPALDMARYADGKLVEHWGGPDQMSLMQQLGVIPAPGQ